MHEIINYNDLISLAYRERLNSQKNRLRLKGGESSDGTVTPYIYVVGLGEKHFKAFDREIVRLLSTYPWTLKKHVRFIMNELIINTQFSMLREVVRKVPDFGKVPAYFNVVIHICENFFSASIEEYGDFFDYFGYLENELLSDKQIDYDDVVYDKVDDLNHLSGDKIKLILKKNNDLIVPDASNRIALNVIENATDHDFYVTSFYKENNYMWKRIYFRIENN